ncbi:hypothetical protein HG535_0H03970 [Zygotorulaspora mrakii]|uniref:AMP-activated protein kinase glycogen-binding domain-containing protein n=1 Tax=Zygotorulaspora mrakii TaxID=42260 RepID=A0A7H9B9E1_ZYGMR|nr:uncharacterized protein HG535_0H03970 [Zygotorulaspora mrakii]QLG75070.1 hypothetical protein HG535_0H03970 [Zygotorulaspora mrakii]
MVKIIYKHSGRNFQNLRIAGDFTDWKALPMVKKLEVGACEDSWEVSVDATRLPKGASKIHFKFIDDDGIWFTDDNYAKEVDESSNENNVKFITENETNKSETDPDNEYPTKIADDGPKSPAPSLQESLQQEVTETPRQVESENAPNQVLSSEPEDDPESVGEPAILVNHSDAEEIANKHAHDEEEPPTSSGTVYTNKGQTPEQYKNFLAKIIAFFTNLFHNWFN